MLAGDAAAAERASRRCCETFERVRDLAALSSQSAELADALYAQARYEEADSWLQLAEKSAPRDDLNAQYSWRRVKAKLLARTDSPGQGEELAGEAARLAGETDALNDHAAVLLDLAEVLRLADRPGEAAAQRGASDGSVRAQGQCRRHDCCTVAARRALRGLIDPNHTESPETGLSMCLPWSDGDQGPPPPPPRFAATIAAAIAER